MQCHKNCNETTPQKKTKRKNERDRDLGAKQLSPLHLKTVIIFVPKAGKNPRKVKNY